MEEDREISCHDCGADFLLTAGDFTRYSKSGVDVSHLTCQSCKSALRSSIAVEPENVTSPLELLHERIPGLQLLHNFISQEEETEIMREIDDDSFSGCEWTEEMSRRVKHFGFPFNYRTLMLDFCRETPPFTTSTASLARKIEGEAMHWAIRESQRYFETKQMTSIIPASHLDLPLSQMTANEYMAGQGIAPHTDTTTCFGPQIFILTCNAGITMTFRRNKKTDADASVEGPSKLSLWLPRRSLLIMSGESRFEWAHSIASRKLDNINGELIQRERRVSLTFRQVSNYFNNT
jgi:alkylated DNA repair dioxygenase AlkB